MTKEVSFDLSPDHTKCLVYVDGRLQAIIHADVDRPYYRNRETHNKEKHDTLFIMCDTAKQEGNDIVISKPLAYMTGFNSLAFGPLRED